MSAVFLKIVFLQPNRNIELARAVEAIMARAKIIYLVMVNVTTLLPFYHHGVL